MSPHKRPIPPNSRRIIPTKQSSSSGVDGRRGLPRNGAGEHLVVWVMVWMMNRYAEQVETVSVSVESIMRRADFNRGVDDVRSGQTPRFDSYVSDSHDDRDYNDIVNRRWDYERGAKRHAEEQAEAILDGPPPELPPPQPARLTDFPSLAFDRAISKLKELSTKHSDKFRHSSHTPADINGVAEFLFHVAQTKAKAAA